MIRISGVARIQLNGWFFSLLVVLNDLSILLIFLAGIANVIVNTLAQKFNPWLRH